MLISNASVFCKVMIAAQDDPTGHFNYSAKTALMSVGAGRDEVTALGVNKRCSFAMIGRKGAKPGSVPQVKICFPRLFCSAC